MMVEQLSDTVAPTGFSPPKTDSSGGNATTTSSGSYTLQAPPHKTRAGDGLGTEAPDGSAKPNIRHYAAAPAAPGARKDAMACRSLVVAQRGLLPQDCEQRSAVPSLSASPAIDQASDNPFAGVFGESAPQQQAQVMPDTASVSATINASQAIGLPDGWSASSSPPHA